ncbi:MAG TPA: hypothetical protein VH639_03185 [Bryobacteraceae bacterium]|jgi:hypothetical protein
MGVLQGSFFALAFYDVAEQIQADRLRALVGAPPQNRAPRFKHPAPEYVRFQVPPVVEYPEAAQLPSGEKFESRIKYFDYGVVCVELEMSFETDWEGLVRLSSRWIGDPQIEKTSSELLRSRMARVRDAMLQPYTSWLSEDYYVIQASQALDDSGAPLSAQAMLAQHRADIARIVRGETTHLSEAEREEVLQSSISYYPYDLLVAGWTAAFLYDAPESAVPTRQLLEYANTQLLEFRHYDEVLTEVLANVYKSLERKPRPFSGWRMGTRAEHLNAMRLEVIELTERADNSIKFLSDMFYARAYRMISSKVGVADYRVLVEEKLQTARELYESMLDEFRHSRAFALEAMVVAILVIELIHLFRNGI